MEKKSKKNFKIKKEQIIGIFAIIIALIVIIVVANGLSSTKSDKQIENEISTNLKDGSAIAKIRTNIAQQAIDGKGTFTKEMCEDIKSAVMRFDSKADWFSKCSGEFDVNLKDTNNEKSFTISDDNNCATITSGSDTSKNPIKEYSFNNGKCKGYSAIFE